MRTRNMPTLPPGRERKTTRSFMIEDSVWAEFARNAADNNESMSEALRDQIVAYNQRAERARKRAQKTAGEPESSD